MRAFLCKRVDTGAEDIISIVAFGSEARTLCHRKPIQDCLGGLHSLLKLNGGSTNYSAALRMARTILQGPKAGSLLCDEEREYASLLLFMSDGQPDANDMGISEMQVRRSSSPSVESEGNAWGRGLIEFCFTLWLCRVLTSDSQCQAIVGDHRSGSLIVHTIAFGSGVTTLEKLAKIGGGKFVQAVRSACPLLASVPSLCPALFDLT